MKISGQLHISTMMAWVIGCAVLFASRRLTAVAITVYVVLAVIAAIDGMYRLAFGPRPRGLPSPWRIVSSPIRLLDTATMAEESGTGRGVVLAIATNVVLIVGAAFWKFFGTNLASAVSHPIHPPSLGMIGFMGSELWETLQSLSNWNYRGLGEIWSLPRWWLLFTVLALGIMAFSRDERHGTGVFRRLFLFAPWLVVIELGHLHGLWIAIGGIGMGPEPDMPFGSLDGGIGPCFRYHAYRFWLVRGGPSTFIAGLAFFRGVGGWRWRTAVGAAAALVPVGMFVSMIWCCWNTNPLMRWFPSW